MNKFHLKKIKSKKELKNKKININKVQEPIKNIELKKKPQKKTKRKLTKKDIVIRVLTIIVTLFCLCYVAGASFIYLLLQDKPELDPNDFISSESSIVYDRDGNIISELGQTIRKNVTYEDLPTSLIDAFVAVEDSRFFEHNGFDIPRFAKAIIDNLKTFSFGQGGSTFTMQLIKNTYFVDDDAGVGATKSIKRKAQEIALAIELENSSNISKKDIFTAYLNKLYFGGTHQNIRGVQKAAEYYFGKHVNELTLPESAMLAGVVNAPNLYNPYNYLEYAQERRDEVLYLMKYHGYITEHEYELALNTKVEDFLSEASITRGAGQGSPYQAYIDQVVDEVYELTGLDPYTTSMKIYTAMDKNIQTKIDEIQAGIVDDEYYYKDADGNPYFYPDDKFEVASICIDNTTGEIYGILGGRNYADGGALLLNHATNQYKQPGSSIKPILDYSQAFEVLGWSTSHYVTDRPITYPGTNILIGNSNGYYQGDLPLKHAVYESLNTPAILALQGVIDHPNGGHRYLVGYMQSMGYDVTNEDFNVQYAIGGSSLEVSPLQMAGAQAALINLGKYNKPHTIRKIEFLNDKPPLIYEEETVQTISPEAAYLTTELLKFNVSGNVTRDDGSHYYNYMELYQGKYQVYAKTGTSNWDSSAKVYGIPNGSIKDGWMIASTAKVTTATWMGYEKAEKVDDKVYGYMPGTIYNRNLKGKIAKMILEKSVEVFGDPGIVQKPDGVQSITHITNAGLPYIAPIEGMPEEYVTTGLIKKSAYSLEDPQKVAIEQMSGSVDISFDDGILNIHMPSYPNKAATSNSDHKYDISLYDSNGNIRFFSETLYGKKSFDYSWIFGSVKYKVDIKINDNTIKSLSFDTNDATVNLKNELETGVLIDGSSLKVTACYGFESLGLTSNKIDSEKITISDKITITIPQNDYTSFYNYLKTLNPNIGESQTTTDETKNPGDIISLTINETPHVPGETLTISRSSLDNAFITYIPVPTITLATDNQQKEYYIENDSGVKVNLHATIGNYTIDDGQPNEIVEWSVDPTNYDTQFGTPNFETNNSVFNTLTIKNIGTYIITVKIKNTNYFDQLTIEVKKQSN